SNIQSSPQLSSPSPSPKVPTPPLTNATGNVGPSMDYNKPWLPARESVDDWLSTYAAPEPSPKPSLYQVVDIRTALHTSSPIASYTNNAGAQHITPTTPHTTTPDTSTPSPFSSPPSQQPSPLKQFLSILATGPRNLHSAVRNGKSSPVERLRAEGAEPADSEGCFILHAIP